MDEINELKRSGMSIVAISNLTGYDRETISKYLLSQGAEADVCSPASADQRGGAVRSALAPTGC